MHAKGNEKHLKSLIMTSTYMIPSSQSASSGNVISDEARDLLQLILQEDPAMRPSINQIKNHSYFTYKPIIPDGLPPTVFQRPLNQNEHISITENYIKKVKKLTQNQETDDIPPIEEINYIHKQIQVKKQMIEKIQNEQASCDIYTKLMLVSNFAVIKQFGLGYRLRNGNYGVSFKDKTYMFMYTEIHDEVQYEMVAYIPIDKTAVYFEMGADFPSYLTKKVKIF